MKRPSQKPGVTPLEAGRRDWRQTRSTVPSTSRQDRPEEAPSMSRSRVQLATAYAPDTLFTWEGAKGICRAVPVARPAEIKAATKLMIFDGIKEAAENWKERALTVRDIDTIPLRLVLDAPLFEERTGNVAIDGDRDFKLTRPDRIGYIPFPLLFRCGTCGRLHEYRSVNEQERQPLPSTCNGHSARWTQVDVVYVHWSGGLQPLSPFRYQHIASTNRVDRIDKCDCGCAEFRLLNEAPVFSEWTFVCVGCGASRDLKQADPFTLALLKPRMDRGETHEWIEINMLPVSYRASSAYYVQKGYFIDFEDRRVVDLMMPLQRPELLRTLANLHGFSYDEPSESEIRDALRNAGKSNEYAAWEALVELSKKMKDLGQQMYSDKAARDAEMQRESWFAGELVQRGAVRSGALNAAVASRIDWARRFDPLRLTIEHDIFVREHINQRLPTFGAVDVLQPDRLLSEAAGDAVKLQSYQEMTRRYMQRIGIDQVVLIRGLPICEYSYGYSRVSPGPVYVRQNGNRAVSMPVRLNAFPMLPDSDQRPIYVLEQSNEAVYIRLTEERVRAWLAANGVTPTPPLEKPGIAGTYLEQYADFGPFLQEFKGHEGRAGAAREFCPYIYLLLHSLCHQIIHALAEMSGLDRDGIGEHIFPADLAFVIYRKGMTPDLGNISAMWRNHSEAFLKRILEPRLLRCGSGSLCDSRGGACPACIMLPDITCIAGNQLLSRAALKGGPPPTWEDRNNPPLIGYFDPALAV
jgi:hypothetical protein